MFQLLHTLHLPPFVTRVRHPCLTNPRAWGLRELEKSWAAAKCKSMQALHMVREVGTGLKRDCVISTYHTATLDLVARETKRKQRYVVSELFKSLLLLWIRCWRSFVCSCQLVTEDVTLEREKMGCTLVVCCVFVPIERADREETPRMNKKNAKKKPPCSILPESVLREKEPARATFDGRNSRQM